VNLIDQIDTQTNHNESNAEWSSNRTPANLSAYIRVRQPSHLILVFGRFGQIFWRTIRPYARGPTEALLRAR